MPRGFGLAATRRANFKMPAVQLAAEHFTLTPDSFEEGVEVSAEDILEDEHDFSDFTISTSPAGPFASAITVDTPATDVPVYVKANTPYSLVVSSSVDITSAE